MTEASFSPNFRGHPRTMRVSPAGHSPHSSISTSASSCSSLTTEPFFVAIGIALASSSQFLSTFYPKEESSHGRCRQRPSPELLSPSQEGDCSNRFQRRRAPHRGTNQLPAPQQRWRCARSFLHLRAQLRIPRLDAPVDFHLVKHRLLFSDYVFHNCKTHIASHQAVALCGTKRGAPGEPSPKARESVRTKRYPHVYHERQVRGLHSIDRNEAEPC